MTQFDAPPLPEIQHTVWMDGRGGGMPRQDETPPPFFTRAYLLTAVDTYRTIEDVTYQCCRPMATAKPC